jgi:hypothetical protein
MVGPDTVATFGMTHTARGFVARTRTVMSTVLLRPVRACCGKNGTNSSQALHNKLLCFSSIPKLAVAKISN